MNTGVVIIMSLFWLFYGVLCFCGITIIPSKYKGKPFDREYNKARAISYLEVGACWFGAYLFISSVTMPKVLQAVTLLVAAVPGMMYSTKTERKYRKMDEELTAEAEQLTEALREEV